MIRINLLPVRVSKKKEAGKRELVLFALIVVLAIVGNSIWGGSRAADLSTREAQLKRTKDEIAQLDRIIGEVKNIKDQQNALKEKLEILDKLKAGRAGPVRMLDELAMILPKRSWLKKMDEKGGAVMFEGSAATIDDVSLFLSALKKSAYYSAVELKKTTARQDGKFKLVDFVINANVNYTPSTGTALASAASAPGAAPAGAPLPPAGPR